MVKRKLSKFAKTVVALAAVSALITTAFPTRIQAASTENSAVASAQKYRNVMYYGDWSIWSGQKQFYPQDIPADQITHLNFAFMDFDSNGTLQFTDKEASMSSVLGNSEATYSSANSGILSGFQDLRSKNPNLKIGVSLGGWSKSGDFSTIAANSSTRATFVKNVMDFVKYTNMDFVDVDWEYPGNYRTPDKCDNKNDEGTLNANAADKANYILLLQDLRTALDKQGKELNKTYELSVALPASKAKVNEGIDVAKLFNVVDFANIMTYDMAGAWDKKSGHQAALYTNPTSPTKGEGLSVDESVNYYLSQGAKPEKVVIGACYYTRGWEKVANNGPDASNPGLFGSASEIRFDKDNKITTGADNEADVKDGEGGRYGGVWSYNALSQLKTEYPGLKEYWDDSAKAPYLYNESTGAFFTYDNARSIQEKVNYVKQHNLGGMIAWMASQDAKTTSTKRDELTKVTKQALFGSADLPKYEIVTPPLNVSTNMTTGKPDWGTGGIINFTLKNNETKTASGDVLSSLESNYKTLKNTKLYIKTNGVTITGGESPCPGVTNENGYYVIDLEKVYEAKLLGAGTSTSFKLKTAEPITDLKGIVSIELTQRMFKSSIETTKQTIYGDPSGGGIVVPGENKSPVINGVSDKEITVGTNFNALNGISATDPEDGDLTNKIVVSGTVDTTKVGTYTVNYSVTDSKGAVTNAKATIKVVQTPTPSIKPYNSGTAYTAGQLVTYNGSTYKAKYWTMNETPGASQWGPWEKVS